MHEDGQNRNAANDEVEKYLESLVNLRGAISCSDPDLPRHCREFTKRSRKLTPLSITQNWTKIYAEFCSCSVALAGKYLIDPEELEERRLELLTVPDPWYQLGCFFSTIGEMLLRPIVHIICEIIAPTKAYKPPHEAVLKRNLAEFLTEMEECNVEFDESKKAIVEADKEPELPPDQPSVVKQEAFTQFNESFTKIVIGLAPTIKINDGAAVALPQQNYTFILKGSHESVGDGAANISFVVSPKLKNPGSQMEKHAKYCKYILDCLEDWRKRIREAHKVELKQGITKHLCLPSLQHIADWIAQNRDKTVTRRIVDTALFNALGTTVNSYALMRNLGRQAAQARQQAIDSKANAKRTDQSLDLKKYPISKDFDRLNANIIMYWEKLPTRCDFVLLDRKPSVSDKFDREKYINGLRAALQSL